MALVQATLLELVTRLANDMDDIVSLTATGNGSTTTFVDNVNVNATRESYDGWEFWGTSSPNAGIIATVSGTSGSTITFAPAMTSTTTSSTAILVNKRGRGFRIQDYMRAINNAITDFNGIARIESIQNVATAFDADTGTATVPTTMLEAYKVEYQNSEGIWCEIRKATPRGGYGWTAEPANAVIRIEGPPAYDANGYTLRMHGYTMQAALSSQSDVCYFDAGGITARAAFYLCRGGVSRDSRYAQMVLLYKEESENLMRRARITRRPGTVAVRV